MEPGLLLRVEEMSCGELVDLVTEYVEGAMAPRERARFERHVDGCSGCRNHLEQMRTTIRIVGRLECPDLSAEAEAALLAAFRTWKSE